MKFVDIVNRDIVNLQNCEQEPIHIPGSIQPHGFLLGIDRETLIITYCSENTLEYLRASYAQLLGRRISEVLDESISRRISAYRMSGDKVLKFRGDTSELDYEFVLHDSGAQIILEAEIHKDKPVVPIDFFDLSRQFMGYMEQSADLKQLCAQVAKGIRAITAYDRVMIYRFDEDYNGEVFAEEKRDDLEAFYGLHYPHTDIPPQARELYLKNLLRIIVDINYTPVPIFTADSGEVVPLDLSHSVLRSVSPIHVQYLSNMGVGATMTISLLHKDRLWGLVACHHYSAKHIHPDVQLAARLQGQFITSQIDVMQLNEGFKVSQLLGQAAGELVSKKYLSNRKSLADWISTPEMLRLCNASGVAASIDGEIYVGGAVPDNYSILTIGRRVLKDKARSYFQTNQLSLKYPEFESIAETSAGVILFELYEGSGNFVMWLREESVKTVNWAGDPAKAIEKNRNGLSPRKSFELWKEVVKKKSLPWQKAEIEVAEGVVHALEKHLATIIQLEEEYKLRELTRMLQEKNAELENLNWISTHDLQEPLRKIQIISSQILSIEDLSREDQLHKVGRINSAAERMQKLLKDILSYSSIKSYELQSPSSLEDILKDCSEELSAVLLEKKATLRWTELPQVNIVPFLVKQLFLNLIYNSLKFAKKETDPQISLKYHGALTGPEEFADQLFHTITFSDNGIGFEPEFNKKVFGIFSRLATAENVSGSGIGLAICYKVMSIHNGFIRAEGEKNIGVTFTIGFPV